MDDHGQDPNNPSHGSDRSEPVRTRWTPKPEQILILESIFNSGMVNPPKDETVRIRKLLEKFGSVGDANVFYWFQNRRSRSRRRQRQIQASLAGGEQQGQATSGEGAIQYGGDSPAGYLDSSSSCLVGSSSSCGVAGGGDLFSFSCQMGLPGAEANSSMASLLCPSDTSNLQYQSGNCMAGFITVFINGVPTEFPRGQIDMKAMFGQDMVLVHSSGIPVPFNEYGLSVESLQHGESYFLVPRLG